MRRTIIGSIVAMAFFAGCQENSKAPGKVSATTAADSLTTKDTPPSGNVMRVHALGHFFKGEPSKDWQLYAEHTYDDQGHEIGYASFSDGVNSRVERQYDDSGHEVLQSTTADKAGKIELRSTWNAGHTEQKTEQFSSVDGRVVFKTTQRWDANGNLLEKVEQDLHLVDYPTTHKVQYVRDAQGFLLEEREEFQGKKIVGTRYKNDAQGRPVEVTHMDSDGKPSQTEYFEYDAQGRKMKRHLQEHSAAIKTRQLEVVYEYEAGGRIAREIHYKGQCDEDGRKAGRCPISETVAYTYDTEGRLATEVREQQYPSIRTMKKRFEYFGKVSAN
jgi:antitoxin component YwqK of YwqJK toxin-antitoxin module